MAPWRTISIALQASTVGYTTGLARAGAATKSFGAQAERSTKSATSSWKSFAKVATVGLAGLALAMGASIKEAISWESAWAGVEKTVDGTAAQMKDLEDGLVGLSLRLPATREEIAGVAEAAGALGIARPFIEDFTEVMIGLGESTNLTADEAATSLAQFANIMGTSQDQFESLGDTLVHLGNNGASTEREILDMALRLAGTGNIIGLTEDDVMALANAMASMGIEAQLGGGAFSRVMRQIDKEVAKGGDKLAAFADVSGMSAAEFAASWKTAPAEAIQAFITGLAGAKENGDNVILMLDDLGIKGSQNVDVMQRLVGGADGLAASFKDAADAEGSLADEVAKRYATAESQIRVFMNKVTNVARIAGAELIPMLLGALDAAERFGRWASGIGLAAADKLAGAWGDLRDAGEDLISILATIWETVGPLTTVLAKLGGAAVIMAISGIATALSETAGFLADNEAAVRLLTTAFIVYLGTQAPAALGALLWGLGNTLALLGSIRAAVTATAIVQGIQGIATGFAMMATSISTGATQIRAGFTTMTSGISAVSLGFGAAAGAAAVFFMGITKAHSQAKAQIDDLKPAEFDERSVSSLNMYAQSLNNLAFEANDAADASSGLSGLLRGTAELLTPLENSVIDTAIAAGDLEAASEAAADAAAHLLNAYSTVGDELGMKLSSVEAWVNKLDLPREVIDNHEALVGAIGDASNAARNGTPVTDGLTAAYTKLADETASATDNLKAWRELVDQVLGTEMSMFDATTKWRGALSGVAQQISTNTSGISAMTEDGRENRDALSGAAQAAIDYAEAVGGTSAGIDGANIALAAGREELRKVLEQTGLTREETEKYLDALGLTPENIETIITANTDAAKERLGDIKNDLANLPTEKTITITINPKLSEEANRLGTNWSLLLDPNQSKPGKGNIWNGFQGGRAGGGEVWPGTWLVGEKGPELLHMGGRGYVTDAQQTKAMLAPAPAPMPPIVAPAPNVTVVMQGGGGGGANYYGGVTNSFPGVRGRPEDIEAGLAKALRGR